MGKDNDLRDSKRSDSNAKDHQILAKELIQKSLEKELYDKITSLNEIRAAAGMQVFNAEVKVKELEEISKEKLSPKELQKFKETVQLVGIALKTANTYYESVSKSYNDTSLKYYEIASANKSDEWSDQQRFSKLMQKERYERLLAKESDPKKVAQLKDNIETINNILKILDKTKVEAKQENQERMRKIT